MDELTIYFSAQLFIQLHFRALHLALIEPFQQSRIAFGPSTIGPVRNLHLQQAQIQPYLDQVPPIGTFDQPNTRPLRPKRPVL